MRMHQNNKNATARIDNFGHVLACHSIAPCNLVVAEVQHCKRGQILQVRESSQSILGQPQPAKAVIHLKPAFLHQLNSNSTQNICTCWKQKSKLIQARNRVMQCDCPSAPTFSSSWRAPGYPRMSAPCLVAIAPGLRRNSLCNVT